MGSSFVKNVLRQLNYTNYTAIADIIDNSLEPDVTADNIRVFVTKCVKKSGTGVNSIIIADDGCGMDAATLESAMSLGVDTGKDRDRNLGFYGAGLKTAAISIGTKLTVFSKTKDSGLNWAELDINDVSEEGIMVKMGVFEKPSKEFEFENFRGFTNSEHGTVVIISDLDRIQNKDYNGFCGTLKKQIRILFNKFIESKNYNFFLNGEKLTPFDTIGNKSGIDVDLLEEGSFVHNGVKIDYRGWYIPIGVADNEFNDYFGRTKDKCGIYVYRQNRLVGYGLDLGIVRKNSNYNNGFRFELFMDGNADEFFGTTFAKMVTEKDRSSIEQDFYDKLENAVRPLVKQCERRDKEPKQVDVETEKTFEQVTETLNKNVFLSKDEKKHPENEKKSGKKTKNENPKKENTTKSTKRHKSDWFGGFELVNDGPAGFMHQIVYYNSKAVVQINIDHLFYKEFFEKLDSDARYKMSMYIACEATTLKRCGYYTNEDVENIVDNYKVCYADVVRNAFTK